MGGAVDVGGAKRGFHVIHAGVAPVAGDVDKLGIGEVAVHGVHKVEVMRCFFSPARLVAVLGEPQMHGCVEPGETAFRGQFDDFVQNGARVDLHALEGGFEAKDHLAGQCTEIFVLAKVAVGVQVGVEAGIVPHHFRHGDARVAAEEGHDQGGAGAFRADHEYGAFVERNGHESTPCKIRIALSPLPAQNRRQGYIPQRPSFSGSRWRLYGPDARRE